MAGGWKRIDVSLMNKSVKRRSNLSLLWKGNKYALGSHHKLSKKSKELMSRTALKSWKNNETRRLEASRRQKQNRVKQIIPNKDTSIELKLQNFLKEQHIEFSTHYPILGQPDIFIKPNICIFADGCYWHKCPDCGFGHGKERDINVTKELQRQNYIVIRLWEHEINNSQKNFLSKITRTIQ